MLEIGDKAPDFSLQDDQDNTVSLKNLIGKKVVLYFYPKDATPRCTREACDFRDGLENFKKKNTVILGVSKDNIASHKKFKEKYHLTFPLLADQDGKICKAYGVLSEIKMFGKVILKVIKRTTFLIDETGQIQKIWKNVSVSGHVDEIASV